MEVQGELKKKKKTNAPGYIFFSEICIFLNY